MSRVTLTFSRTDQFGHSFSGDAYTDDGKAWRWVSSDHYVSIDACRAHGIPVDEHAQMAAINRDIEEFIAEYRKHYQGPSAEERSEAMVAHDPEVKIVNILTGESWYT